MASSSSSRRRSSRHQQPHLLDNCWELVFKHLCDPLDLESLSLVSHRFPSIINRIRTDLTISDRVYPRLLDLVSRFNNLTSIKVTRDFTGNIDVLLSEIASFDLPSLHSLDLSRQPTFPSHGLRQFSQRFPTLKSLNCSFMPQDLGLIVDCFPNLERIDAECIQIPVRDLKPLILGLTKLRKVNISGNFQLRDSSIFTLCQNCKFLEELIVAGNGREITQIGVANAIRQRPQLMSLTFSHLPKERGDVTLGFIDALVSLKGLTFLELCSWSISDVALCALAEEGLPLRKLSLECCKGYGYGGIASLLTKCNNLHYLDLRRTEFLNDQWVIELSSLLGKLSFVNLSGNKSLTHLSLFAILENCPLITDIRMEEAGVGKQLQEARLVVKSDVKFIYLALNSWLDDRSVTMIASVCPNLEMMDLSYCHRVAKGAIEVLRSCRKIRCMKLTLLDCDLSEFPFRVCFDVPTLFVLNLSYLNISDEELSLISKNCYNLKELELEDCREITVKGVKQVVKNCKQLRMINLCSCEKVSPDVVAWMVSARPSLRKIRPPPGFCPTEHQRDLFLRRGCFVGQ